MNAEPTPAQRTRSRLPATVIALGAASFFNDIGSEMSFPLLPVLLVSLGAGPTYLGIVEGIADATASVMKLAAGFLAERLSRTKPLVIGGYGLPCSVRPLLALATAPIHVLAIRVTDRIGKGLRTAPRDLLIAQSVPSEDAGRAFGFHRTMDHAGAVIGPLCATALLAAGASVPQVFLAAMAPSLLSLVAVAMVKEPARPPAAAVVGAPAESVQARLPRSFASYVAIVGLFGLANSSDAFLLLRASEIGVPTAALPLLWTALNVSRMTCTYFGGKLADRFSRARLIAGGWLVFAACYFGLGLAHASWQVWALFFVYGIHTGLCEPAERALVRDLAPEHLRGRAYGMFHGVVGVCAIPAGILTGWLWQEWGAATALGVAACTALAAAGSLLVWERD